MTQFTGIGTQTGYSDLHTKPFFVVPYRGINLLVLRNGQGYRVRAGDPRLGLDELSPKEVDGAVREYVFGMRHLAGEQSMEALKELWTRCRSWISIGARIFALRAKGTGLSYVEAAGKSRSLRVDVAILPRKNFKVAFRFLQHPDGAGVRAVTKFKPEDASWFIQQLNSIYSPQLNIGFELADSKWTLTRDVRQPVTADMFERFVVQDRNPHADFTVFHVGRWAGDATHPNATYFDQFKSAVIHDNPIHPHEITVEPIVLTLAHETGHFLQYRRDLVGHPKREKVLLSSGIQSTLIDKELVSDLNPW